MQFPEPRFLQKRILAESYGTQLGLDIHVLLTHTTILPRDKPFVISVCNTVHIFLKNLNYLEVRNQFSYFFPFQLINIYYVQFTTFCKKNYINF